MKMQQKTKLFIASLAIFLAGVGVFSLVNYSRALTMPLPDQGYQFVTTLQASIDASSTSMTLVRGTWANGTSLSSYQCFTLDLGSPKLEYVCGTASGTAISALVRGIDPLNPATSVTALKFSHRVGTDVRITDFPGLQIIKRLVNGQDSFPNALIYDSGVSTTTLQGNGLNLASVDYVNGVALAGAPNATTTIQGIVQFATPTQVSAGTMQGSTGAFLVAPNYLYKSTPGSGTTVPVTLASGKISQGFIDLTQDFAFSGAVINSATTTLAATGTAPLILRNIRYTFPSATGTASSSLISDVNGVLTWGSPLTTPGAPSTTNKSINQLYQNTTGRNLFVNITMVSAYTCSAGIGYTAVDFKVGSATTSMLTMATARANDGLCTNGIGQTYSIPAYLLVPNNYWYTASTTLGSPAVTIAETPF